MATGTGNLRRRISVFCGFPSCRALWDDESAKKGVSVGANIAEGSKRTSRVDKARIFNIAEGEAAEAMSVLDVAERLKYGTPGRAQQLSGVYEELIGQIERLRQDILSEVERR